MTPKKPCHDEPRPSSVSIGERHPICNVCVCVCVCVHVRVRVCVSVSLVNKTRRVELSTASLLKVAPTAEERKVVHSQFLSTLDPQYEGRTHAHAHTHTLLTTLPVSDRQPPHSRTANTPPTRRWPQAHLLSPHFLCGCSHKLPKVASQTTCLVLVNTKP